MTRTIHSMSERYAQASLDLIENVFTAWRDPEEGRVVRALIEYGFRRARELGFEAVIVEGDPRNYNPRGFETSSHRGIVAGPKVELPSEDFLMVKELVPGALERISGVVDYSFYQTLA